MTQSSQNESMDGGVLDLVARWRGGDQQAAEKLFGLYAGRLIALAQGRLSNRLAGRVDAEDVVQSAYRSFFSGARADRFSLQHGGDLWRLLVAITLHKLGEHHFYALAMQEAKQGLEKAARALRMAASARVK